MPAKKTLQIDTFRGVVIDSKLDLLRFSEVANNRLFLDPFQRFIALEP